MSSPPARNRRADARRSRTAILDAAIRTLDAEPDASIETIAATAGVTRQTVYAHFPSRDHLLAAVIDRITENAVAAMDAAEPDVGSAREALIRVLDAAARGAQRHPVLLQRISSLPVDPRTDLDRHAPIADRLNRIIRRGQQAGEVDTTVPAEWLVAVTIKLGHAASEAVDAGRMSHAEAADALRTTLLRTLGTTPAADSPPHHHTDQ